MKYPNFVASLRNNTDSFCLFPMEYIRELTPLGSQRTTSNYESNQQDVPVAVTARSKA
jgi:hypothetical protein